MSTGIEWTEETWNPIRAVSYEYPSALSEDPQEPKALRGWHCERVSPGCQNCYAEAQNVARRFDLGTGLAYNRPNRDKVSVYLDEATLEKPLHWRKPRRVFVCSMTDLFGDWVTDEMLDQVFAVMALTPHITYQVLTKRPERMRDYVDAEPDRNSIQRAMWATGFLAAEAAVYGRTWPLSNVWLGVSVEDQQRADERIPVLLDTPAAVRFLSCEPLLSELDLRRYFGGTDVVPGRRGVPRSGDGRVDDRLGGPDLESGGTPLGPLVADNEGHPVFAASRRESDWERIPAGESDDRRAESPRLGSPAGVAPLQRADTRWSDHQSSERLQGRQPASEHGTRDAIGASTAQGAGAGIPARDELSWVIVGGESGPGARPCDLAWIRNIVAQCREAGTAVFVKQLGAKPTYGAPASVPYPIRDRHGSDMAEWPDDLRVREWPR